MSTAAIQHALDLLFACAAIHMRTGCPSALKRFAGLSHLFRSNRSTCPSFRCLATISKCYADRQYDRKLDTDYKCPARLGCAEPPWTFAIGFARRDPAAPPTLLFTPFDLHRPFYTQRPFAPRALPRFICFAAYFFVRQDSRTSVADYASLRLCRPTASIRLCTACPPNRMSISLRFSSFQLIVHAELRLAYLHHSYTTIGVSPWPTPVCL